MRQVELSEKLKQYIDYMVDKEEIKEDVESFIKLVAKFEIAYGIVLDFKIVDNKVSFCGKGIPELLEDKL